MARGGMSTNKDLSISRVDLSENAITGGGLTFKAKKNKKKLYA